MNKRVVLWLAIALSLALAFSEARSQEAGCLVYEDVVEKLEASKYRESLKFRGISNGNMIELWLNSDTGTWTQLAILPDGCTLAIGSGEDGYMRHDVIKDPAV